MSIKTIDARGLSCPQPVVMTKKALDEGVLPFVVLVDSEASRENVSRLVRSRSLKFEIKDNGDGSSGITVDK